MKKSAFILLADEPILDFVNTLIQHAKHDEDLLSGPKVTADFFRTVFASKIKFDEPSLVQLKQFRRNVKLFFLNVILKPKKQRNKVTSLPWFKSLNPSYSVNVTELSTQDQFNLSIHPDFNHPAMVIISKRLIDFLLTARPSRIKKCKSKTCSHLFYDKTKANTRLWCSMSSCGNLAKIRKFRSQK